MKKPVIEIFHSADGTKKWYREGELHREDGPAIEHADGTKMWYREGKPHRDDGPAIERASGTKSWFLNGQPATPEQIVALQREAARLRAEAEERRIEETLAPMTTQGTPKNISVRPPLRFRRK